MATNLRSVEEICMAIQEEMARRLADMASFYDKEAAEQIKAVTKNRPLILKLEEAGYNLDLYESSKGHQFTIDLGFFPSTKTGNQLLAAAVRNVRSVIGCRLKHVGNNLGDSKKDHIKAVLEAVDYPGVQVSFSRKAKKGLKCKIVTVKSSYKTLVCS